MSKIQKKWNERLKHTDEMAVAHKLIKEFLKDIKKLESEKRIAEARSNPRSGAWH